MTARRYRRLHWSRIWWAWFCVVEGWKVSVLGLPLLGRARDDWQLGRCDRRFKAHRACGPRRVQIVELEERGR